MCRPDDFPPYEEPPMKVAVVGSRAFADPTVIQHAIAHLRTRHPDLTVVSGGAKGADSLAEDIARSEGIPTVIHLPEWDRLGRSAGFQRNQLIVRDADLVLAFYAPGPLSRGTSHTVALAKAAGKPVHVYHEGRWDTP
jgi:hypothetical protein